MPRDSSGNYTLPTGNPVQSDTLVESSWANTTMQDLGAEITDSLSRSGKGGLTGVFQIIDSDGAVPGLAFTNEPTSGLKRTGLGDVRMQVLSLDRMRWRSGVAQRPEVQDSGTWKEVALTEPGSKVLQGVGGTTVMPFYNGTPPPGWTLLAPDVNVRQLTIGGTGGTIGGSIDPNSLTDTVSVVISGDTAAADAPHTHAFSEFSSQPNEGDENVASGGSSAARQAHTHTVSGTTGVASGGANHAHGAGTLAGSGDVSIAPRYAMMVLGTLDA